MDENMIASAVSIPDPDDTIQPSTLKRRPSASLPPSPKRARLSPPRRPSAPDSTKAEERKRGRRLFGALLGTLSQTSSTPGQRRRAEVERKTARKIEDGRGRAMHDGAGRIELSERRWREQRLLERQAMRLRHRNLLSMAGALKTSSEPVLYYRPWKLRPSERDTIDAQLRDANAQIDREIAEFEQREQPKEKTEAGNGHNTAPQAETREVEGDRDPVPGEKDVNMETGDPKTAAATIDTEKTGATNEDTKMEEDKPADSHPIPDQSDTKMEDEKVPEQNAALPISTDTEGDLKPKLGLDGAPQVPEENTAAQDPDDHHAGEVVDDSGEETVIY